MSVALGKFDPVYSERFTIAKLPNARTFELSVDSDGKDAYQQSISSRTVFDSTWRFAINWVRSGEVVFDLGANMGVFCIPLYVMGAEVHAFELLCSNINHLVRAAEKNKIGAISIVHGAVSNRTETVGVVGHSA